MLLQFWIPDFYFAIFTLSNQCIGPVSGQMPWESVGMLAKLCQDTDAVYVKSITRNVLRHTWGWGHPTVAKAYTCQWYISPVAKHCCYLFLPPDLTHLAQLAQQQIYQFIACHEIWSRGRNAGLHSEICWPCGREVRGEGQRLVSCWKYTAAQWLPLRRNLNCFSFCKVICEWSDSWRL